MSRKLLSCALVLALSAMMTTLALAEDVFITKYGKRYHKADSRFIKGKEVTKLTREEAEERGYKPSSDFEQDAETAAAKPATTKAKK